MADARTKIGHGLAKVLGIKLEDQNSDPVTRGESAFSVSSADSYVEPEPTVQDWVHDHSPSGRDLVNYFISLFPFVQWIHRYNLQWLIGDLVAGKLYGLRSLIPRCSCPQVSPSAQSSCRKAWPTRSSLNYQFNLVSTLRSWAS